MPSPIGISSLLGLARSLAIYRLLPGRTHRFARLYGPWITPGDLCFDIGAHVGNRSLAMARLGARVIAVEPQPLFATYLRRATQRDDSIQVLETALGAEPGETVLHVSERTPTVTTTDESWKEAVGASEGFSKVSWDRQIRVGQTTLDALIAEHGRPKLCKIDVEGAEATILAGLSEPIPYISFEYIPAARSVALECIDRLEILGRYVYQATIAERTDFVDPGDWSPDEARAWIESLPFEDGAGDLHARLIADDDG